jgi:hypothetical protein
MEVNKETAKAVQKFFTEAFNNMLLPMMGIKDWVWEFEKLEPKDELREIEIVHQKAATALTAANAGLKVVWTDEELKISGTARPEKEVHTDNPNQEAGVTGRRGGQGPKRISSPELSPETGREILAMYTKNLEKITKEAIKSIRKVAKE